jgi:hypothetical protein
MTSVAPRGKDGLALGVGDIVDVWWQDETCARAMILSIDELMVETEIRIFDSVVLWDSGSKGLASTAVMTLVSKAGDENVV